MPSPQRKMYMDRPAIIELSKLVTTINAQLGHA
jgi:hypothetical protein